METNEQICDLFKTIKGNIDTTKTLRIKENNPVLRDNNLGSQIAFYREKKKLTQKELAKILNVSRDWIVKIENTRLKKINVKLLKRIFKVLEMEDKVKLTSYLKYILNEPAKTLKNFLKDNHLNCVQLGKFMKTSPAVIRKWTRGNHIMTEYSFIKLKKALVENGYDFSGFL